MKTNDKTRILAVASHKLLKDLVEIGANSNDTRLALAVSVAIHAVLAIRDTQNRADWPEVYDERLKRVEELIHNPGKTPTTKQHENTNIFTK